MKKDVTINIAFLIELVLSLATVAFTVMDLVRGPFDYGDILIADPVVVVVAQHLLLLSALSNLFVMCFIKRNRELRYRLRSWFNYAMAVGYLYFILFVMTVTPGLNMAIIVGVSFCLLSSICYLANRAKYQDVRGWN